MSKTILLAYHRTQQPQAASLVQAFSATDANFEHVVADSEDTDFYQRLLQRSEDILLLLSDNYLKSSATVNDGLQHLQSLFARSNFKAMVVPGVDVSGAAMPTQFSRISHIIHYMNYWQDEYLASRQAGRKAGGLTEEMDQLIKTNRQISTQVGELLRFLRDQDIWTIEKLEAAQFAPLLNFYGLKGQVTSFSNGAKIAEPATVIPVEEIEEIEIPVEEEIEIPVEEEIEVDITPNRFDLEEVIVADNIQEANVLQMETSRVLNEEIPSIEAEEIAYQSSLDMINDYIDQEDFAGAKILLEQLVESHPKEATVWSRLGLLAEAEGDFLQAGTHYVKALELDPSLPELDFKLGMIINSYHPDQIDRAIKHFENATQKNPQHTEAFYQLAVMLNEKSNRVQDAIPLFEKVLKLDPGHEFANYDLALIYFDQADKSRARSYYVSSFENNPELRTDVNDQAFDYHYVAKEQEQPITESEVEVEVEPMIPVEPEPEPEIESSSSNIAIDDDPKVPIPLQEETIATVTAAPSTKPVDTKTVLITGGTSGIGRASAAAFINAGYQVIITGRRAERLSDFMTNVSAEHRSNVKTIAFDVRDINSCQQALNSLPASFQDIDILVNNAGLAAGFDPIHQGKIEDWNTMIDTNIKGLLFMTRLISPGMVKRQSGHIINVCSTAGHETYPKGNVYCATKHAVDALTKGMRLDLFKHKIRVSQVSPAHVEETEFAKVRFHGDTERAKIYEDFNPLKSSDVAEAILFIASRPAHVNVQDIVLLGSQQANNNTIHRSGRIYD